MNSCMNPEHCFPGPLVDLWCDTLRSGIEWTIFVDLGMSLKIKVINKMFVDSMYIADMYIFMIENRHPPW